MRKKLSRPKRLMLKAASGKSFDKYSLGGKLKRPGEMAKPVTSPRIAWLERPMPPEDPDRR
jgi:hypothetical protein